MKKRFSKRIHTIKEAFYHTFLFFSCSGALRKSARRMKLDTFFVKRIMLAVTQVNGCRLCSYFHTKEALKSGMQKKEIRTLLGGDLSTAPFEEATALLYAQHYAETGGKTETETTEALIAAFGQEKSKAILYQVRMIMFGNIYGNTFDGFIHRLKGRGSKESSLARELVILIGIILAVPIFLLLYMICSISKKPEQAPIQVKT